MIGPSFEPELDELYRRELEAKKNFILQYGKEYKFVKNKNAMVRCSLYVSKELDDLFFTVIYRKPEKVSKSDEEQYYSWLDNEAMDLREFFTENILAKDLADKVVEYITDNELAKLKKIPEFKELGEKITTLSKEADSVYAFLASKEN